jgi:hypothetical protein
MRRARTLEVLTLGCRPCTRQPYRIVASRGDAEVWAGPTRQLLRRCVRKSAVARLPFRTIDYDNSDRASFGSAVSNPRLFHGTVLHAPCEEHICCDRRGIVVCRCSRGSSNSAKPDTRAGCGSTLDDHTACNAARCEPDDGSSRIHDPHAGSSARSCSRTTPGDRTNPAGTTPRYGRTNLRDPSSRPRTTHR